VNHEIKGILQRWNQVLRRSKHSLPTIHFRCDGPTTDAKIHQIAYCIWPGKTDRCNDRRTCKMLTLNDTVKTLQCQLVCQKLAFIEKLVISCILNLLRDTDTTCSQQSNTVTHIKEADNTNPIHPARTTNRPPNLSLVSIPNKTSKHKAGADDPSSVPFHKSTKYREWESTQR
jgi:hypothetical protein